MIDLMLQIISLKTGIIKEDGKMLKLFISNKESCGVNDSCVCTLPRGLPIHYHSCNL